MERLVYYHSEGQCPTPQISGLEQGSEVMYQRCEMAGREIEQNPEQEEGWKTTPWTNNEGDQEGGSIKFTGQSEVEISEKSSTVGERTPHHLVSEAMTFG